MRFLNSFDPGRKARWLASAALCLSPLAAPAALAGGIQPSSSAVFVHEADREGTIDIKNISREPVLLYAKITKLVDDDFDGVLIPSPAAVVVPAGETQTVRILYRSNGKLAHEHMARVVFSGIAPKKAGAAPTGVKFSVGHDMPVVIRQKDFTPLEDKWQFLQWSAREGRLCVKNDTKYVIRFSPHVKLKPAGTAVALSKSYALPGTEQCARIPADTGQAPAAVVFSAVSDYNYLLKDREAPVAIAPDSPGFNARGECAPTCDACAARPDCPGDAPTSGPLPTPPRQQSQSRSSR